MKEVYISKVNYNDKIDLFNNISKRLYEAGYVKETFNKAVISRENDYPTGLELKDTNIAIPHTDPIHVIKPSLCIVTLDNSLQFNSMEDKDKSLNVNMVFFLALNSGEKHLAYLSNLMEKLTKKEIVKEMLLAETDKELEIAFNKGGI